MIYLLLSIFFSTLLVVILRAYTTWNIKTEHGIVFNYLVCCLTGLVAMPNKNILFQLPNWNGWIWCLLLGFGFIVIFLLIGKSTTLFGVSTTSIAFKLSFIIPTIIAILFYGDSVSFSKTLGILMAISAVFFITYQPNKENEIESVNNSNKNNFLFKNSWILPLAILVGSGITDAGFNFIQRNFTPPNFDHIVTIMVFLGAFITGLLLYGKDKALYQWKNVFAGIILGIPNYGSLYFLLLALKHTKLTPSILFPINNLGIIGLSALFGFFIFKEKFNTQKYIGFALAVLSIIIIGFF